MSFKLSLAVSKERVMDACGKITLPKNFKMDFQINPGEKLNCVLGLNDQRMYTLEWGLIPDWSRTLNNRGNLTEILSDGAVNRPSTRIPFREKRGYILCDGIFFIRKKGLEYTPYRIVRKDGQLMKIACLWDEWKKENNYLATTAMLVQKTGRFISPEFPVELYGEDLNEWLHNDDIKIADQIINKKINLELYTFHKVTDKLFNDQYNAQDLYAPVPEEINLFSHL